MGALGVVLCGGLQFGDRRCGSDALSGLPECVDKEGRGLALNRLHTQHATEPLQAVAASGCCARTGLPVDAGGAITPDTLGRFLGGRVKTHCTAPQSMAHAWPRPRI